MGGDPFVLMTLRPPQSVVDRLPELLKGVSIKVSLCFAFGQRRGGRGGGGVTLRPPQSVVRMTRGAPEASLFYGEPAICVWQEGGDPQTAEKCGRPAPGAPDGSWYSGGEAVCVWAYAGGEGGAQAAVEYGRRTIGAPEGSLHLGGGAVCVWEERG